MNRSGTTKYFEAVDIMKKNGFLFRFIWSVVCVLGTYTSLSYGQSVRRPNIILYIADDLGAWDIPAYGNDKVKTPNLDRLRKESMLFDQAFATSPTCGPARSALFTGLLPHRNGAHVNRLAVRDRIQSMVHYFNNAGYRVAIAGKLHVGPQESFPFEYIVGSNRREPGTEGKKGMFSDLYLEPVDQWLGGYDGEKPFVLIVADHCTHMTWPLNPAYTNESVAIHPFHVDTRDTRRLLTRYYTDITKMDDNIGDMMKILDKHKLSDKAIMLFTADQGPQLPFGKWTLYDYGVQVPLLVRWPGQVKAGSHTKALVSHVDIVPTLLDAIGAPIPTNIDGTSFYKVLRDPGQSHREMVFALSNGDKDHDKSPVRMLRTSKYKYIVNLEPNEPASKGKDLRKSWIELAKTDAHAKQVVDRLNERSSEELYDLENDRFEMINLAHLPKYKQVLEDFRKKMNAIRQVQGDVGDSWKEDLKRLPVAPGPNPLVPYSVD
ncbi:sulfatase [Parapedobacter sp. SGR-10]|uniref:sulfatase family protein n=1 Tax=Parapedobacter sp. SGR-10 TaxID=2710879 RepID=UPI0013D04B30|nr:sulfatase [Parapedobacter sp. SGR-10]NGF55744.1 sulfatase [Parapedobacter sp. SGR-10]